MSADISSLGNLQEIQPLDLDEYVDNKESTFQLPKAGRYLLRVAPEFPTSSFGATQAGALSITIDPTIVAPHNEGFLIRFTKVSCKQFKRGAKMASQAGDFLRACGLRGTYNTNQDLADAVASVASRTFEADLDWRAYNKNTKFSVEGMSRFPSDGQGGHLSYFLDPTDKDENGDPVKLRANLVVSRYVPAA